MPNVPSKLRCRIARCRNRCAWPAALLIAACSAAPPLPEPPSGGPAGYPASRYTAAVADERIYEIDPARTLVQIYAYRGGTLARLGHDHVIASRDVAGFVSLGRRDRRDSAPGHLVEADAYLSLAGMTVDEDELRAAAGFSTEPSQSDREGTRGNMLRSLEADVHPFVSVHLRAEAGPLPRGRHLVMSDLAVTLHGVTLELTLPVVLTLSSGALTATGSLALRQSDFGITPFSVLGGSLAVRDEIDIKFDVQAVLLQAVSVADPGDQG